MLEAEVETQVLTAGGSTKTQRTRGVMAPIRAIVFDTNVFGKAKDVNTALIRRWAQACGRHDAQLWLPEVVRWELAEHTARDEASHLIALRAYNRSRQRWGVDMVPEPALADLATLTDLVVRAGAVIVPLSELAAIEGIKDQILQRGPGSFKAEVKTGAADSAWLRSVFEYNEETFDGLLIVSGDTAAIKAIGKDLSEGIRSTETVRQIADLLEPPTLAPLEIPLLRQALSAALKNTDVVDTEWEWAFSRITELAYRHLPDEEDLEWQLQRSAYKIAGVGGLEECFYEPWTQALRAMVELRVSASDMYARQDRWGDAPEYAVADSDAYFNLEVTAQRDSGVDGDLIVTSMYIVDKPGIYDTSVSIESNS